VEDALARLRGGLIVAVQADERSVLNAPAVVRQLARCAEQNGAAGVRVHGIDCIIATRTAVTIPIIGLVKQAHEGFEPSMTSTVGELLAVVKAGADVVAFDATDRPRFGGATVVDLIAAAHDAGVSVQADCSSSTDARAAAAARADILATTLAGYTPQTAGVALPALDLVRELAAIHPFVIAEGSILTTEHASQAFLAGASAICVGSAITDIDQFVRQFVQVSDAATRGAVS